MQPFVVVTTYVVQPGRGAEFAASIREDFLPAYKKYADLDGAGLFQRGGLSAEQVTKANARRAAVAAAATQVVYRFIQS